jgi:hypothetical protein
LKNGPKNNRLTVRTIPLGCRHLETDIAFAAEARCMRWNLQTWAILTSCCARWERL